MQVLPDDLLYLFAIRHHIDKLGQWKTRERLLVKFYQYMINLDKEEYAKCDKITISNEDYTKQEARYLAILLKDMNQFNDFCNGEFLTKKFEKPSPSLTLLFYQAMSYSNIEEAIDKMNLAKDDLKKQLEKYRVYYATKEEKYKFDQWMRRSDFHYRKLPIFLGYQLLHAYLKKETDPNAVYNFLCENHIPFTLHLDTYIKLYLPYCSSTILLKYQFACKHYLLESVSTIWLEKWFHWLSEVDIMKTPNYKEAFFLQERIDPRCFYQMIHTPKSCDIIPYRKLLQHCEDLVKGYEQVNEKRKEQEIVLLKSYWINNQSSLFKDCPFTILDFYSLTVFPYQQLKKEGYLSDPTLYRTSHYSTLYRILNTQKPKNYQETRPYYITAFEETTDISIITLANGQIHLLSDREKQSIWNYIEQVVLPRPVSFAVYQEISKELLMHRDYLEQFSSSLSKIKIR